MIADLFTLIGIVPLVLNFVINKDQRFLNDTGYIKNANSFVNDRMQKINQGLST